ncbi:MAG: hypothetical protein J2P17_15270, partial [Mycobacterium sp.]|nr:hypothetical protein [Mycobacterium sp.]
MRVSTKQLVVIGAAALACAAGGVVAVASTTTDHTDAREPASGVDHHPGAEEEEEHEATVAHAGAATGSCGVERWAVKTGTDPDASKINTTPQPVTIAQLTGLPAPSSLPADSRVSPTETTEYQVSATLKEYKLESD